MPSSGSAIRVLHVSQPTTAGVARIVADFAQDQVSRGLDVAVACPAGGRLADDVRAAGGRWLAWPASRSPGPSTPVETLALAGLTRAEQPDVVHLHSSKAGLAGRLAVRGRRPTVFQPNAWSFQALEGRAAAVAAAWERAAVRWTHALAVVSPGERIIGESAGVHALWELIPNGVDLRQRPAAGSAERAVARRELGLPTGPLAVCVGRLSRQKGQDILLAAWPQVLATVPAAVLVLVGDGPDRARLEATAPPSVRFAGDVRTADDWLRAANVAVLPSRWEGLSLVALEALALSRSLVATPVSGVQTALTGGAGAVVPVEDVHALAAALTTRLADPARADREGMVGRQLAEVEYDLRLTSARMVELYTRLLARA